MILVHGIEDRNRNLVDRLRSALPGSEFFFMGDSANVDLNVYSALRLEEPFLRAVGSAIPDESQVSDEDFGFFIRCYQRHWKRRDQDSQDFYNTYMIYLRYVTGLFSKGVEAIVFTNIPHEGLEIVLYQQARRRSIPTLILFQSIFRDRLAMLEKIEDMGEITADPTPADAAEAKAIMSKIEQGPAYMAGWKGLSILRKRFIQACRHLGKTLIKPDTSFWSELGRVVDYERWFFSLPALTEDELKSRRYVYFPLHLQPEMTTSSLGGIYSDQLFAIEQLSRLLPAGWQIIVKENPKQTTHFRGKMFRKRLALIPNVIPVGHGTSSFRLIEHSRIVATITGTAGWESVCLGRPVIMFGLAWYRSFPGVFPFDVRMDLEKIAQARVDVAAVEHALARYLASCRSGVVDPYYSILIPDYDEAVNQTKVVDGVVVPWLCSKLAKCSS